MFQNILHAPLQLRSGVSLPARSLLGGLLERDVSKRLGQSRDFVSAHTKERQKAININTHNHSRVYFILYPGGAAGTFILYIHQLG